MNNDKVFAIVSQLQTKLDELIAQNRRLQETWEQQNELLKLLIDREDQGEWWRDGGDAPF